MNDNLSCNVTFESNNDGMGNSSGNSGYHTHTDYIEIDTSKYTKLSFPSVISTFADANARSATLYVYDIDTGTTIFSRKYVSYTIDHIDRINISNCNSIRISIQTYDWAYSRISMKINAILTP